MPPPVNARAGIPARSANACEACRRRKVKCSGQRPCRSCQRHGIDCVFTAGRRGYSEAYVQRLMSTIRDHEKREQATSPLNHLADKALSDANADAFDTPSRHDARSTRYKAAVVDVDVRTTPCSSTLIPSGGSTNYWPNNLDNMKTSEPASESRPSSRVGYNQSDQAQRIQPSELATGPAFEHRFQSLMRDRPTPSINRQPVHSIPSLTQSSSANSTPTQPPNSALAWRSATELTRAGNPPQLPSQAESSRLLDLFLSVLGVNQHFLDPRAFSDFIADLYSKDAIESKETDGPCFTQYLLVMAMAMLIRPKSTGEKPPGNEYFAEAIRRTPPPHELASFGIVGVEILSLTALYLQWRDRQHDAYIYIGSALRLAVALGCSMPHEEQTGKHSDITHRVRVFWTAYMLDRRLSAALGLPMTIDDRQVRVELPRPSAGFESPQAMVINVRIAQISSEIMTTLYGIVSISQQGLLEKIHDVLRDLSTTEKSIPPHLAIDFSEKRIIATRTSASLHLMLYHAVILCIRPIMLQVVKEKVLHAKAGTVPPTIAPAVSSLCRLCHEAALKSLKCLTSITRQELISLFGFFDLEQTFSSAFVLVMTGFIRSTDGQRPPDGLQEAAEVLQTLEKAGNEAATRRLSDLRQFCYHVWPPESMPGEWHWLDLGNRPSPLEDTSNLRLSKVCHTSDRPVAKTGSETQRRHSGCETSIWNMTLDYTSADECLAGFNMLNDNFSSELCDAADDIYSSFYDPSLSLVGVDQNDWAEMEKIFMP